jgi:hypothetical protein
MPKVYKCIKTGHIYFDLRYLERKKIVGGDETSFEYRWGQRALKETSKRQVIEFMSEVQYDIWNFRLGNIIE